MNRWSIIPCLICASCTGERTDHTDPSSLEVEAGVADRLAGPPAKFMVQAALQAAGKPSEVASAVCSRQSPNGFYDCQYTLAEQPSKVLRGKVLQCDVAFYLEGCPEHLGD